MIGRLDEYRDEYRGRNEEASRSKAVFICYSAYISITNLPNPHDRKLQ